jgi:SagB-type dehydrogenase family enzyme
MAGGNWATGVARRYHEATKHSYESVRRSSHRLDFSNWPYPFKEYVSLEPVPVPNDLVGLLRFGAGTVRSRALPGGPEYHFRTYSSAGGLYPVELYLALAEGLHYFHPREVTLRRLRDQDVRGVAGVPADAVLFLSGILWRTAWKYEARGYRHVFWDAGTMLANLLALAEAAGMRPRLLTGFVDDDVDRVLGIDGRYEAGLGILALGESETAPSPRVDPLGLEVAPLSPAELRYHLAEELHAAGRLYDSGEVERYRAGLPPEGGAAAPPLAEPLEPVLRRRVSVRDFALDPVPRDELLDLLARALGQIPADVGRLVRIALVANAVEGVAPGIYDFEPPAGPELVRAARADELRRLAGYLVLEQYLGARAAAVAFLLADLEAALSTLGNRGYRAAQLEAGIVAGRLQVAAFGLGWGATCSTFYDDDVTRAVAPQRGDSPLLCVALGRR